MTRTRALIPFVALLAAACGSNPTPPQQQTTATPPSGATSPRIVMFYAGQNAVAPGEPVSLCYGTDGATAVKLSPEAKAGVVGPSPNRCVEVAPAVTTTYTLTASNASGQSTSQTIEVAVDPKAKRASAKAAPAPAADDRAHIHYFRLDSTTNEDGKTFYKLCFMTQNAERVEVEPAAIPPSRVVLGCFSVAPATKTDYTLTVTGKRGEKVKKSLTVGQ